MGTPDCRHGLAGKSATVSKSDESGSIEGRYANYFNVGHNCLEFLLDFGQFYPESDDAQMHTRIVTAPAYAKAFWGILGDSILQYERSFGAIPNKDE